MWWGKRSSEFLASWVGRRKWARCHAWFLSPEICKNKWDVRRGLGRVPCGSRDVQAAQPAHSSLRTPSIKGAVPQPALLGAASPLFICGGCSDVLWALSLCCQPGVCLPHLREELGVVNMPGSSIMWKKTEVLGFLPHIFFCYITEWMFVSVYALIPCVFWNLIVLGGGKLAAW